MARRVLMILEEWLAGGTEEYVGGLGRYLRRRGDHRLGVLVLGRVDEDAVADPRAWADDVIILGRGRSGALLPARRSIVSWRPDVAHLHLYTSLFPVTLLLRGMGVPLVVTTVHMPLWPWSWRHRLMWRAAMRLADQVVGVSHEVVRSLGGAANQERTSVVPPALPPLAAHCETRAGQPDGSFLIAGIGRLAREKDWPTLLRALQVVRGTVRRRVRLELFGDGPLRRELQDLVAALRISEVVAFKGAMQRSAILRELGRFDLSVLPSRFEGLGIAALEAMQRGVPTITSDFGASEDFIEHGVTGHRFPRGDWQALARLIQWHLEHEDEARGIGRAGQEFVRARFAEERTFGAYPRIYQDRPAA